MRNRTNRNTVVNPGFHQAQVGLRNITRGILAAGLAHGDLQHNRDVIAASPNVVSLNEHRHDINDRILAIETVDALAYLALADEMSSVRATVRLIRVEPISSVIIYDQDAEIS